MLQLIWHVSQIHDRPLRRCQKEYSYTNDQNKVLSAIDIYNNL